MMQDETIAPAGVLQLDAAQARVLGCLIEKEATTPDVYPLTANAAHAAANQKTARDPVMRLDPGEVQHALRALESMELATQHFSSRAERYAHRVGQSLGLPAQQVALLGLLMLRGAQTAHELLARSERMVRFEGVEDVRHHLERLMQRTPALAVQLPRGGGQREDRYAHLLCGPVDAGAYAASRIDDKAPVPAFAATPDVEARIAALEAEVTELRTQLAILLESSEG